MRKYLKIRKLQFNITASFTITNVIRYLSITSLGSIIKKESETLI